MLPVRRNSAEPNASPRIQPPPFQSPQLQLSQHSLSVSQPPASACTQDQMEQVLNNAFLDSLAQSRPNLLINKSIGKPSSSTVVDVTPSINVTPSNRKSKKRKQPPKVSVTVQPQAPPAQQSQTLTVQPPSSATSIQTSRLASPLVNVKVVSSDSSKAPNVVGPISSSPAVSSADSNRTTTLPSFFVSNPNYTVVSKNNTTTLVGVNVNSVASAHIAPVTAQSLPSLSSNVIPSPATSQIGVVNSISVKTVPPVSAPFVNNAVTSASTPPMNHLNSSTLNSNVNCVRGNASSGSGGVNVSVPPNLIPIPSVGTPSSVVMSVSTNATAIASQLPGAAQQPQPMQRFQTISLSAAKQQVYSSLLSFFFVCVCEMF